MRLAFPLTSFPAARHSSNKQSSARKRRRIATAIVSALAALSSVGDVVSVAHAKDTMADCAKFVDGWKAAYNAKNADALESMYEPKTGTYSSVFWTGTGRTVLSQAFRQELSAGNTMTSIKCERSNATGDVVASSGTWSAASRGPDGKPLTLQGHWQSVAVANNGKYAIVDHTSNMQLPPPK